MIVIESPALDELLDDVDAPVRTLTRLRRKDPIVRDPTLVAKLLSLHRALERAPRGLASDSLLIEWIAATAGALPRTRSFDAARRDLALRRACELLSGCRPASTLSPACSSPGVATDLHGSFGRAGFAPASDASVFL